MPMIRTLDYAPPSKYMKYLVYFAHLGVMHGCWLLLPEDTLSIRILQVCERKHWTLIAFTLA